MDTNQFRTASHEFAFELLRSSCGRSVDHAVQLSPLSVRTALSIPLIGSRGATRQAFLDTMRLPRDSNLQEIIAYNQQALVQLTSADTYNTQLSVANACWGQQGVGLRPSFI